MNEIIDKMNQIYPLSEKIKGELRINIKSKTYKKGEFIIKNDKICKSIYYINYGICKQYILKDSKEFTIRFPKENDIFTDGESLLLNKVALSNVVALEEVLVNYIDYTLINELSNKYNEFNNLLIRLNQMVMLLMITRMKELIEPNASKRYINFLKVNKDIIQRISLGDIASYLGISQVSLSRIRGRKLIN